MYSIWNNYSYNKKNKRVRFHNLIQVVLVPKISDLYDTIDIWWSNTDKLNANKSMYDEIQVLRKRHPAMTLKQAMKLLYQPNNLRYYDPSNFVQ